MFSQIDIFHSIPQPKPVHQDPLSELCYLMREMLTGQARQNELLQDLLAQTTQGHRRRSIELGMWKRSHPELADFCKRAATKLERVQTDLLSTITEEVEYNSDTLLDSEFGLSEFVDRFGTKFMHLNALLQVLAQLGNAPDIQIHPSEATKDA